MNVSSVKTKEYENKRLFRRPENKPKQSQFQYKKSGFKSKLQIFDHSHKFSAIKILISLPIAYNTMLREFLIAISMKSTLKNLSDAELLTRYGKGDEASFHEIVNRYKNGLYGFLRQFLNRQELVEDVFQETFLQLFTSRESFDDTRPLRPWLFTIAANKAKDALRKWQRTAAVPIGTIADSEELSFDEMLNTLGADTTMPYEELEKNEAAVQVERIIANMPANLREILILAYFHKFSYKQMASMLSIPIGTVKSRLHTAVARFAKEWKASVGSKKE
jgi:RNA polymerase sigma-70 factor (ECF subfamily)